jgi:hypothetical protein
LISDEGKEVAYTRLIRKMGVYNPIPSRMGAWPEGTATRNIPIELILEDPVFGWLRPALGGRERAGAGRREALSREAAAALMSSQCPHRGPVARPRMRSVAVVSGKPYLPEVRRKPRYYRVSGLNVRWARSDSNLRPARSDSNLRPTDYEFGESRPRRNGSARLGAVRSRSIRLVTSCVAERWQKSGPICAFRPKLVSTSCLGALQAPLIRTGPQFRQP